MQFVEEVKKQLNNETYPLKTVQPPWSSGRLSSARRDSGLLVQYGPPELASGRTRKGEHYGDSYSVLQVVSNDV